MIGFFPDTTSKMEAIVENHMLGSHVPLDLFFDLLCSPVAALINSNYYLAFPNAAGHLFYFKLKNLLVN